MLAEQVAGERHGRLALEPAHRHPSASEQMSRVAASLMHHGARAAGGAAPESRRSDCHREPSSCDRSSGAVEPGEVLTRCKTDTGVSGLRVGYPLGHANSSRRR